MTLASDNINVFCMMLALLFDPVIRRRSYRDSSVASLTWATEGDALYHSRGVRFRNRFGTIVSIAATVAVAAQVAFSRLRPLFEFFSVAI